MQLGVAQWPGVPAWPITAPMFRPTNVTEVGWKFAGTKLPDPAADSADPEGVTSALDRELGLPPPVPVTVGWTCTGCVPAATGCPWLGPWLRSVPAICGTVAAAAITITIPAADITARPIFRRCARCWILPKVPGRGASGSTSAFSQSSIRSRGSLIFRLPAGLRARL